jgi:hypothetical protein
MDPGLFTPRPEDERGAILLDVLEPGWTKKINPRRLSMGNLCGCAVGQTFNVPSDVPRWLSRRKYSEALERLGITTKEEEIDHGFTLTGTQYDDAKIVRLWCQSWQFLVWERKVMYAEKEQSTV